MKYCYLKPMVSDQHSSELRQCGVLNVYPPIIYTQLDQAGPPWMGGTHAI